MTANVQSMPLSLSLADELAKKLLQDGEKDALALANTVVILPTKRAILTLKDAFVRQSGGKVFLLPKILALGALEETAFFENNDILPAIDVLERKAILTSMIMADYAKYGVDNPTPDKAAALADSLAEFLDEFEKSETDLGNIKNLVPDEFAFHLQSILSFLELVLKDYPKILKEKGKINPAAREVQLIYAKAKQWEENPPQYPVIVAGITGSLPAPARLLTVVANMPKGLVILPALDTEMDDETWNAVSETGPQFEMKKLLLKMGVERKDVSLFAPVSSKESQKNLFIREVMRPFDTTDKWRELKGKISKEALASVTRIDAENEGDEALAVALILRQVLEEKGKRAMLVTTSRDLAKRVSVQMLRWGVTLDDSAGQKLTDTKEGVFLNLLADAAASPDDSKMLALLKHPLAAAKMNMVDFKLYVRKWEKAKRLGRPFALDLESKGVRLDGFFSLFETDEEVDFLDMLGAHIKLAEQLAASADRSGGERLWKGDDGQVAADALSKLFAYGGYIGKINPIYYPALFKSFISGFDARKKYGFHPRLDILGPIEARLQTADVVVIAGLNEGSFPRLPDADPWLSRQMRAQIGMPSKDEEIGIAAHDFTGLFSFPKVYLTRAKKEDGAPTIPSRWLLRMDAVLQSAGIDDAIAQAKFLDFAEEIDMPASNEIKAIMPPSACPPVSVRPRKMSVTKIEKWMRDPYSIYAEYVLNLTALKEIDYQAGAAEYGTAVHNSLEQFVNTFGKNMPENAFDELLKMAEKEFERQGIKGANLAFYWPRFERVAKWFIAKQKEEKGAVADTFCEVSGEIKIPCAGGDFILSGKVDRIDVFNDKHVRIVDYKTGEVPSSKEVHAGYAPQLPLEGVMLEKGAFASEGVPFNSGLTELQYWKLAGTAKGSSVSSAIGKDNNVKEEIDKAYKGLVELIGKYDDEKTPYLATPRFSNMPKYSDYEYLERIKEWAVKDDDAGDKSE